MVKHGISLNLIAFLGVNDAKCAEKKVSGGLNEMNIVATATDC